MQMNMHFSWSLGISIFSNQLLVHFSDKKKVNRIRLLADVRLKNGLE